jgi:hypothetical protein
MSSSQQPVELSEELAAFIDLAAGHAMYDVAHREKGEEAIRTRMVAVAQLAFLQGKAAGITQAQNTMQEVFHGAFAG